MAWEMAGPTACEARWKEVLMSFASQRKKLLTENPEAKEEIQIVHDALVTILQLVQTAPRVNGNGAAWKQLADTAEVERAILCKHMDGKALFIAIVRLYAATHREMKRSLQNTQEEDPAQNNEEFREQRRRKRIPSAEDNKSQTAKKTATAEPSPRDPRILPQGGLPTRKFFAPLRTTEMEVERPVAEDSPEKPDGEPQQESGNIKSGRPPPHCAHHRH